MDRAENVEQGVMNSVLEDDKREPLGACQHLFVMLFRKEAGVIDGAAGPMEGLGRVGDSFDDVSPRTPVWPPCFSVSPGSTSLATRRAGLKRLIGRQHFTGSGETHSFNRKAEFLFKGVEEGALRDHMTLNGDSYGNWAVVEEAEPPQSSRW